MLDNYSKIRGVRWLCDWSADAQQNVNTSLTCQSSGPKSVIQMLRVWFEKVYLEFVISTD